MMTEDGVSVESDRTGGPVIKENSDWIERLQSRLRLPHSWGEI